MKPTSKLYPSCHNPFLIEPDRPLPEEMAVLGAGNIGPDIAYYLRTGLPEKTLYLVDVAQEPLQRAEKRFRGYAQKGIDRKKLTPQQAEQVMGNIVYTTNYDDIRNCGLVIEAATESLDIKKKIFTSLESVVDARTILASNTSSIPADQIFSHLEHPERTTITHFFSPAWRSMAVEVINWAGADRKVLDYLLWFFAQTGKAPVVTANVSSFMLNRVFENWTNEAAYLLDGATTLQVDSVTEEFVGAGPFFVLNMAGGNPLTYSSQQRRTAERACYEPSPLLLSVDTWKTNRPGTPVEVPLDVKEWIRDRMLGLAFSQCFDIADRNIGTPADLNFGSLIGLGFKKGVFDIMADLGPREVNRVVDRFAAERPGFPQPKRTVEEYLDFPRDFLVDDKDGVRILTLRRPQAANALGLGTCDELLAELEKGAADPGVKGFVITGYGTKAFCAGADISGFVETFGDREAGVALARGNSRVLHFIDRIEKPVVAALNGLAMGGGVELAWRCHARVATPNVFFQLPEINLGILPGMGGATVPYRKWPHAAKTFHAMIGEAKRLPLHEAVALGIIDEVADDFSALVDAAVRRVDALSGALPRVQDGPVSIPPFPVPEAPKAGDLSLSREALALVARVVERAAAADTLEEALEINYQGSGDIACTEAAREGVSAFLEKRKPVFRD